MTWIMTYTGEHFDLVNPKKEQVKLEDIAHHLSQICRFTGASKFFYSVAQHCLEGAAKMEEDGLSYRLQLLFMLHDAPEAYYTDVNKPLKSLIGKLYNPLEENAFNVIIEAFGIEPPTQEEWDIVMKYDLYMFQNEISVLMAKPEEFDVEPLEEVEIEKMSMDEVESLYANVVIGLLMQILSEKLVAVNE